MAGSARAKAPRLHYSWIIAGVTFLALLVAAGVRAVPSVLIVPLGDEFGWSRGAISLPISLGLLVYGLVGPFAAGFLERFGARAVILVAMLLLLLGLGPTIWVTQTWQLLPLWGIFAGAGTGIIAMILAAHISSRWFVTRRGLVMGVLSGSVAAGNLVFLPLLANIAVGVGWRWAVIVTCAVVLASIPVVALLMRDRPSDVGGTSYGAREGYVEEAGPRGVNPITATFAALGRHLRSRDFWLLSGSFFVCGASTLGLVNTHFIPACVDHGIPEGTAAGILAFMGLFNVIGTTGAGWLSDRMDSRYLLFWFYALRGLSLIFLPYAFGLSLWGLSLFGAFYGLDWIATVPPTVRLTTNAFGARSTAVMFGWIMVCHQIGAAAAAYGAGLMHNIEGDYWSAFVFAGTLCFVAAVLVLRIGSTARKNPRPALATA
jgi:predicted MFS family arabinose efflux permease